MASSSGTDVLFGYDLSFASSHRRLPELRPRLIPSPTPQIGSLRVDSRVSPSEGLAGYSVPAHRRALVAPQPVGGARRGTAGLTPFWSWGTTAVIIAGMAASARRARHWWRSWRLPRSPAGQNCCSRARLRAGGVLRGDDHHRAGGVRPGRGHRMVRLPGRTSWFRSTVRIGTMRDR